MYSLALHTQGTLVGIGVSVAAAHRSKVQRAGQDRLHVRAVRLQKETTNPPTAIGYILPEVNTSNEWF